MSDEHTRTIARGAAVVSLATLASRGLGFVRDVVTAWALGAGPLADAFFVAFRVPNLLRRLFGEGSLTMAFVPVFTRTRREGGDAEGFAMARSVLVWLLAILGVITVAAMVFAEPLAELIAPGFAGDPGQIGLTANLLRICFPYILFISVVALCMGLLNAMGHFLAPALSPCLLNLALIAAAVTAVWLGLSVPYLLACGVLVGGALQLLLQLPYLRRFGFAWRGPWSWRNKGVLRTGRLMLPTVFGAAVYQVNILIGTVLASLLTAGSISWLYYADRLVQFPLGVFGVAVSQAALPSFSGLAAEGDTDGLLDALNSGLRLTLFICLPATAGLVALAWPIVSVLFERGAFGAADVSATAWALVAYGAGLPFFGLVRPLVSAFYALEDTRTPVIVATVCLVVYVAVGLALMGPLGHVGLALAVTVSSAVNVTLLLWALRRRFGPWARFARPSARAGLLSLAMGLGAFATMNQGWLAVALIPAWGLAFAAAAVWLKVPEATLFWGALRRRLARRGA